MAKSDSSKKKKAAADKDGSGSTSSNKKMKLEKQTGVMAQQQAQQQTSSTGEITMTIPRKRDSIKTKSSAAAAAKNSNESSSSSSKNLPKIPKKSYNANQSSSSSATSSPSMESMMAAIPKKNKNSSDRRASATGSSTTKKDLDSMTIPKKTSHGTDKSAPSTTEKQATSGKVDNKSNNTTTSSSNADKASSNGKQDEENAVTPKDGDSNKPPSTTIKTGTGGVDSDNNTIKIETTTTLTSTGEATITPKKVSSNNKGGGGGTAPPRQRGRPPSALKLKIDTAMANTAASGTTSSSSKTPTNKPPLTPGSSGTGMDQHPFARGSVIEVLHGGVFKDPSGGGDDSWWSDDSDAEEDETKDSDKEKQSIRLCDVIDRVPSDDTKNHWKYYVHYRDFNRRMDEWIPMERIVSPPSIGNAKARALKKEEEKQKRREKRLEEKKKEELTAGIDVTGPRASRRRSSVMNTNQQQVPTGNGSTAPVTGTDASAIPGGAAPGGGSGAEGETDLTPRRTRLRRRSTVGPADDDGTVVASNQGDKSSGGGASGGDGAPPPVVMAAEKGVVAIQTQAAATTTVGEHVVATIPAQELDEHEGLDEASLREHEEVTKVKNVEFLELGAYQMETWYFSPLPKELLSEKGLIDVLYVCEFTFSMFSRKSELRRFQSRLKPHMRHPPGNEIYRNGNIAMFEVDGFEQRIYCQNLCYIAKLFLDHKTLYFDVDPFLFYVLCEVDERGFHPVGYYSKEKYSDVGYNLACILTFPCHQRKGYGRFLIAFSYELSKKEEKVGSPEKPMSDLGQQAYKPYWASTIVDFLLNQSPDSSSMSIMDISKQTSIMAEDIVYALNQLGMLKIINGVYFIAAEEGLLRTLAKKYPVKKPIVDPSKLHWTPFITDVKRDKFSIHSKKANVVESSMAGGKSDAVNK